eukprot:408548_1
MSQTEFTQNKLLTVSEAVSSRHSCRKFLSTEVPLDLIIKILNESRLSPSSSNLQPWKIYLIHGETKTKLTSIIQNKFEAGIFGDAPFEFQMLPGVNHPINLSYFKKHFPKYRARQAALGKLIFSAQGIKRDDMEGRKKHIAENWEFFGAPIALFFTIDKRMSYGQYPDLGIIIGTIMLLCEQYGLSTCCQVAWSLWHKSLRKILNINENELIFCGMCIGYEDKKEKVNRVKTDRMCLNELMIIPKISDDVNVFEVPSRIDVFISRCKLVWVLFKGSNVFSIVIVIMLALFVWMLWNNGCNFC